MSADYGAISGFDQGSEHPSQQSRRISNASKIRELIAKPWVRAVAALSLVFIVILSSISSPPVDTSETVSDATTEVDPNFYPDQLVNHFNGDKDTWSNRYYVSTKYWRGPGHPVFLIIGGEGVLDPNPLSSDGLLYPFISQHLAPHFGAAVIEIEHRFYGPYQPIMGREPTTAELVELLTPQQALADMVQLVKHFKNELHCLKYDRSSHKYCPVITVGGSYPGFLSAMFRVQYPDVVDIAYASSAPLKLYDQTANQYAYYDIVTAAAERLSPGCAAAVSSALDEAKELIKEASSVEEAMKEMNMCYDTVPEYIIEPLKHPWKHHHPQPTSILSGDVMMAIGFSFADFDMDAYPPGPDLGLYKACKIFQMEDATPMEKVRNFFQLMAEDPDMSEEYPDRPGDEDKDCFDLSVFLPDGDNARITTSDWSGSGGGIDGKMWDFQLCHTLVDAIGFSKESMFPARKWTYEDLTKYCQLRYGKELIPQPLALARNLHFDDLVKAGASNILFTNGLQDMWSGGSYLEDVSDTILALNFENGAHHSDLTHEGPTDKDTEDIKEGYVKITEILEKWLHDIKPKEQ
ncbi:hypothetical protein ACHAXR_010625 [Thalassiosira sp. AJA248-18]